MITDTKNLHTLTWLAEASGVPLSTLYRHVKSGRLEVVRVDNAILIAETALPDWIKIEINKKHHEKVETS